MLPIIDSLSQAVERYQPRLPLESLIQELNRIYHSFEAESYDVSHPEIHSQLPPLWNTMLRELEIHAPGRRWRVLDFGCGTGFEAAQVVRHLGQRLESLTCYDPCLQMLDRCREQLVRLGATAQYCQDWDELTRPQDQYDLIVTNSLLHHLPDPIAALINIASIARPDAWWIAGHEPSRRYFKNPACREQFRLYRKTVVRRKLLDSEFYIRRSKRLLGWDHAPASETAKAAHKAGLFASRPSVRLIEHLVDTHVPHSFEEAAAGRGFDFKELQINFQGVWHLHWVRTYAFMGPYYEGNLEQQWQSRCALLRQRNPDDGANFCSVWRKA